jgi:hypothetical protein
MKDCPLCQGTGFYKGCICVCITGVKKDDMPDELKAIFGDIFNGKEADHDAKKPR